MLSPGGSAAQDYPAKPVRIIVPYPPGGLGDLFPRALGSGLAERLGQPVVIDNRPGASQIIGAQLAARATPDGYTLFFGSVTSLAINVSAHRSLPYDPVRDFAPVTLCFSTPLYLIANAAVAATSVRELIALARARPGKLSFASGGPGSSQHLAAEMFKSAAGIDVVHVPYKGAAPAMADVMAGQVDFMFEGGGLSYLKDGKVRALAVTSLKRSPAAPGLPTMNESGLPGFEATIWFGIVAPTQTPRSIIARLARDIAAVLDRAEFRERLATLDIAPSTPDEFARRIDAEIPKWRKVIADAKIAIE
ncbi:MAG TPA: tripartite tricarboxylate transporter substrate binding protein [Burkholderiales bacterium]|nr:tripartite tricarboxylate transporter substrate binding protein [Burkholderiales bacterium]